MVKCLKIKSRETLLGQLKTNVRQTREEFLQRTQTGKVPKGKNLPEMVNNMVYVRQLEAKVGSPAVFIPITLFRVR